MKKHISIIIFSSIFIFNCWAIENCPQLSGKYRCSDGFGGSVNVNISQNGNEFILDGIQPLERVIADGHTHQVANSSFYRNAKYRSYCKNNSVLAKGEGEVYQGGFYLGKAYFNLELKNSSHNLRRKVSGHIQGTFMRTPINMNDLCYGMAL